AADHGVMNLLGAMLGGVPMCRGAGGMAGHIRFGARTGGALVILGTLLLVVALFLSDSVDTLFRLFPMPVLGVILFFGGIELAASANGDGTSRPDRIVMVVTAGIALWNMGAGYGAGLLLHHATRRGFIREAKTLGLTLEAIRELIVAARVPGNGSTRTRVLDMLDTRILQTTTQIAALTRLRKELKRRRAALARRPPRRGGRGYCTCPH